MNNADPVETFRLHEGSDYGFDSNGQARREALRRWQKRQKKTKVRHVHDADPLGNWIGVGLMLLSAALVAGFVMWLWS